MPKARLNETVIMMAPCQICGFTMQVKRPIVEIVNQSGFSAIMISHSNDDKICAKCGQQHVIMIPPDALSQFNLPMSFVPLPDEEPEKKLIVMP